ncbi:MAG: tetratricopeptide repeat protein [Polyangiales bacterium]
MKPWRALALVAWMVPSLALAQPAAVDTQARAAFERGIAEVDAGRFANAVAAFEESYRIRPVAVVLNNLAAAYARMGRYQLAIATYQRYLTEGSERLSPERVQTVRERLAELRRDTPTVTLRVTPETFSLTVDGRASAVAGGEVTLDPGSHVLEVSAPAFHAQHREFQLAPGAREAWAVTLQPAATPPATPAVTPPVATAVTPSGVSGPLAAPTVAPTPHPAERAPTSASITSRWWFWTAIGVGVAAITTGVIVATSGTADPPPSTTGVTLQAVRGGLSW